MIYKKIYLKEIMVVFPSGVYYIQVICYMFLSNGSHLADNGV